MASPGSATARPRSHGRNFWWAIPLTPALGIVAVAFASAHRGLAGVLTVVLVSLAGLLAALFAYWQRGLRWYVKAAAATMLCVLAAGTGLMLPADLGGNPDSPRAVEPGGTPSTSPGAPQSAPNGRIAPLRLVGARLAGADLRGLAMRGADLRGADLRDADLRFVDLSNACLRGADLTGARLDGTMLVGADLTGTLPTSLAVGKPSSPACP